MRDEHKELSLGMLTSQGQVCGADGRFTTVFSMFLLTSERLVHTRSRGGRILEGLELVLELPLHAVSSLAVGGGSLWVLGADGHTTMVLRGGHDDPASLLLGC